MNWTVIFSRLFTESKVQLHTYVWNNVQTWEKEVEKITERKNNTLAQLSRTEHLVPSWRAEPLCHFSPLLFFPSDCENRLAHVHPLTFLTWCSFFFFFLTDRCEPPLPWQPGRRRRCWWAGWTPRTCGSCRTSSWFVWLLTVQSWKMGRVTVTSHTSYWSPEVSGATIWSLQFPFRKWKIPHLDVLRPRGV